MAAEVLEGMDLEKGCSVVATRRLLPAPVEVKEEVVVVEEEEEEEGAEYKEGRLARSGSRAIDEWSVGTGSALEGKGE